MYIGLTSIRY